jgi:hypothetical protein
MVNTRREFLWREATVVKAQETGDDPDKRVCKKYMIRR